MMSTKLNRTYEIEWYKYTKSNREIPRLARLYYSANLPTFIELNFFNVHKISNFECAGIVTFERKSKCKKSFLNTIKFLSMNAWMLKVVPSYRSFSNTGNDNINVGLFYPILCNFLFLDIWLICIWRAKKSCSFFSPQWSLASKKVWENSVQNWHN